MARAAQYTYQKEDGHLASMKAGKDDAKTIQTGQVGEIAEATVGDVERNEFGDYDILALGGIPEPHRRNSAGKIQGDLQNDANSDVAAGTKVRLRLTDRNRSRTFGESQWFKVDDIEQSDPAKNPTLEFDGVEDAEFIGEGRVVVLEAKNARNSFDINVSNSNLEFPFIGGYE